MSDKPLRSGVRVRLAKTAPSTFPKIADRRRIQSLVDKGVVGTITGSDGERIEAKFGATFWLIQRTQVELIEQPHR